MYFLNVNIKLRHVLVTLSIVVASLVILFELFIITDRSSHSLVNGDQSYCKYGFKSASAMASRFLSSRSIDDEAVHVMFIFFQASRDSRLAINVKQCLSSLLNTTGCRITIHIFGDEDSFSLLKIIVGKLNVGIKPKVVYHELSSSPHLVDMLRGIHNNTGKVEHGFSHPYFYLSLILHKQLPEDITKVILLDTDINVKSDIARLYELFNDFSDANLIGIARENQPTYRYMFYEFRRDNPGTRVGEPPPNGLTGFNSGVVLLNLNKMRKSVEYNYLLSNGTLDGLSRKYKFQGNLGDQDVFTLLSLEHEHLFYILPCGWNRQLCKWWEKADFEMVFGNYYSCKEEIHILHGNCQTDIT